MHYIFKSGLVSSPAETVMFSLIATAMGIALLLAFILLRRAGRKRYFMRRDRRVQFLRDNWEKILRGDIPVRDWFTVKMDRDLVEEILLDRIATASVDEIRLLQELARRSGLMKRRIHQVRHSRGWNRRIALIALGRMQLPESIPALSEALDDSRDEMVTDAIRGLGMAGTPEAAQPILRQVSQKPNQCPPQVLQTALAQCYRSNPEQLLQEVLEAEDAVRPVLARAFAEVADTKISGDLMKLAMDSLAEVRASAARIIAAVKPSYALNVLSMLAGDSEWFVRLRAAVAIGDFGDKHGIPLLVNALCDSNRFVRLRAASQLIGFRGEEARVIRLAMQTEDGYALQALISEIQRSGRIHEMVNDLNSDVNQSVIELVLGAVVQNGFVSILTDLLLIHPNRHVRARLARILAKAGDVRLLAHLRQVNVPELGFDQQKLLRRVISQLEKRTQIRETIAAHRQQSRSTEAVSA